MNDLISRQETIDYFVTNVGWVNDDGYEVEDSDELREIWTDLVNGVPSAEPEHRWIPVTDRLPKENGDYLVTGRHGAVNKRKYEDGRWYGNWAVIAWMPLPEPWKGEEDAEVY